MIYECCIILVSSLGIIITSSAGADCPAPFVSVMGECFSLSKTRLPWHHARHYCLGMGGDLATPSFLYALKTYILEREGEFC